MEKKLSLINQILQLLSFEDGGEESFFLDEAGEGTCLDDPSGIHDVNPIGVPDSA